MARRQRPKFPFPLGLCACKLAGMRVRPMTAADADALADLAASVPGHIVPRHEIQRSTVRAWVVEEDGAAAGPLGYVICSVVADEAEILALATRPEARRRGLGRALLNAATAAARDAGARRVLLEVARDNAAARRLYESAGFAVFNVRRGYYRASGQDALEMELVG